MGIKLRLLDKPPDDVAGWEAGMMWPSELYGPSDAGYSVVLRRHRDAAGHEWPIVWHTRSRADEAGDPMWTVTGTPPAITVAPSIHVIGVWHGWIRNGELVEAKYPQTSVLAFTLCARSWET